MTWIIILEVVLLFIVLGISSAISRLANKIEDIWTEVDSLKADFDEKFNPPTSYDEY